MSRFLTLSLFGRNVLENRFASHDSLSLQLSGDHLGSGQYQTDYAQENGDPFRSTRDREGLAPSAEGELAAFDPAEIAGHRKERNSKLKPLRGYAVETTMPWALLIARGFPFAQRVRKF